MNRNTHSRTSRDRADGKEEIPETRSHASKKHHHSNNTNTHSRGHPARHTGFHAEATNTPRAASTSSDSAAASNASINGGVDGADAGGSGGVSAAVVDDSGTVIEQLHVTSSSPVAPSSASSIPPSSHPASSLFSPSSLSSPLHSPFFPFSSASSPSYRHNRSWSGMGDGGGGDSITGIGTGVGMGLEDDLWSSMFSSSSHGRTGTFIHRRTPANWTNIPIEDDDEEEEQEQQDHEEERQKARDAERRQRERAALEKERLQRDTQRREKEILEQGARDIREKEAMEMRSRAKARTEREARDSMLRRRLREQEAERMREKAHVDARVTPTAPFASSENATFLPQGTAIPTTAGATAARTHVPHVPSPSSAMPISGSISTSEAATTPRYVAPVVTPAASATREKMSREQPTEPSTVSRKRPYIDGEDIDVTVECEEGVDKVDTRRVKKNADYRSKTTVPEPLPRPISSQKSSQKRVKSPKSPKSPKPAPKRGFFATLWHWLTMLCWKGKRWEGDRGKKNGNSENDEDSGDIEFPERSPDILSRDGYRWRRPGTPSNSSNSSSAFPSGLPSSSSSASASSSHSTASSSASSSFTAAAAASGSAQAPMAAAHTPYNAARTPMPHDIDFGTVPRETMSPSASAHRLGAASPRGVAVPRAAAPPQGDRRAYWHERDVGKGGLRGGGDGPACDAGSDAGGFYDSGGGAVRGMARIGSSSEGGANGSRTQRYGLRSSAGYIRPDMHRGGLRGGSSHHHRGSGGDSLHYLAGRNEATARGGLRGGSDRAQSRHASNIAPQITTTTSNAAAAATASRRTPANTDSSGPLASVDVSVSGDAGPSSITTRTATLGADTASNDGGVGAAPINKAPGAEPSAPTHTGIHTDTAVSDVDTNSASNTDTTMSPNGSSTTHIPPIITSPSSPSNPTNSTSTLSARPTSGASTSLGPTAIPNHPLGLGDSSMGAGITTTQSATTTPPRSTLGSEGIDAADVDSSPRERSRGAVGAATGPAREWWDRAGEVVEQDHASDGAVGRTAKIAKNKRVVGATLGDREEKTDRHLSHIIPQSAHTTLQPPISPCIPSSLSSSIPLLSQFSTSITTLPSLSSLTGPASTAFMPSSASSLSTSSAPATGPGVINLAKLPPLHPTPPITSGVPSHPSISAQTTVLHTPPSHTSPPSAHAQGTQSTHTQQPTMQRARTLPLYSADFKTPPSDFPKSSSDFRMFSSDFGNSALVNPNSTLTVEERRAIIDALIAARCMENAGGIQGQRHIVEKRHNTSEEPDRDDTVRNTENTTESTQLFFTRPPLRASVSLPPLRRKKTKIRVLAAPGVNPENLPKLGRKPSIKIANTAMPPVMASDSSKLSSSSPLSSGMSSPLASNLSLSSSPLLRLPSGAENTLTPPQTPSLPSPLAPVSLVAPTPSSLLASSAPLVPPTLPFSVSASTSGSMSTTASHPPVHGDVVRDAEHHGEAATASPIAHHITEADVAGTAPTSPLSETIAGGSPRTPGPTSAPASARTTDVAEVIDMARAGAKLGAGPAVGDAAITAGPSVVGLDWNDGSEAAVTPVLTSPHLPLAAHGMELSDEANNERAGVCSESVVADASGTSDKGAEKVDPTQLIIVVEEVCDEDTDAVAAGDETTCDGGPDEGAGSAGGGRGGGQVGHEDAMNCERQGEERRAEHTDGAARHKEGPMDTHGRVVDRGAVSDIQESVENCGGGDVRRQAHGEENGFSPNRFVSLPGGLKGGGKSEGKMRARQHTNVKENSHSQPQPHLPSSNPADSNASPQSALPQPSASSLPTFPSAAVTSSTPSSSAGELPHVSSNPADLPAAAHPREHTAVVRLQGAPPSIQSQPSCSTLVAASSSPPSTASSIAPQPSRQQQPQPSRVPLPSVLTAIADAPFPHYTRTPPPTHSHEFSPSHPSSFSFACPPGTASARSTPQALLTAQALPLSRPLGFPAYHTATSANEAAGPEIHTRVYTPSRRRTETTSPVGSPLLRIQDTAQHSPSFSAPTSSDNTTDSGALSPRDLDSGTILAPPRTPTPSTTLSSALPPLPTAAPGLLHAGAADARRVEPEAGRHDMYGGLQAIEKATEGEQDEEKVGLMRGPRSENRVPRGRLETGKTEEEGSRGQKKDIRHAATEENSGFQLDRDARTHAHVPARESNAKDRTIEDNDKLHSPSRRHISASSQDPTSTSSALASQSSVGAATHSPFVATHVAARERVIGAGSGTAVDKRGGAVKDGARRSTGVANGGVHAVYGAESGDDIDGNVDVYADGEHRALRQLHRHSHKGDRKWRMGEGHMHDSQQRNRSRSRSRSSSSSSSESRHGDRDISGARTGSSDQRSGSNRRVRSRSRSSSSSSSSSSISSGSRGVSPDTRHHKIREQPTPGGPQLTSTPSQTQSHARDRTHSRVYTEGRSRIPTEVTPHDSEGLDARKAMDKAELHRRLHESIARHRHAYQQQEDKSHNDTRAPQSSVGAHNEHGEQAEKRRMHREEQGVAAPIDNVMWPSNEEGTAMDTMEGVSPFATHVTFAHTHTPASSLPSATVRNSSHDDTDTNRAVLSSRGDRGVVNRGKSSDGNLPSTRTALRTDARRGDDNMAMSGIGDVLSTGHTTDTSSIGSAHTSMVSIPPIKTDLFGAEDTKTPTVTSASFSPPPSPAILVPPLRTLVHHLKEHPTLALSALGIHPADIVGVLPQHVLNAPSGMQALISAAETAHDAREDKNLTEAACACMRVVASSIQKSPQLQRLVAQHIGKQPSQILALFRKILENPNLEDDPEFLLSEKSGGENTSHLSMALGMPSLTPSTVSTSLSAYSSCLPALSSVSTSSSSPFTLSPPSVSAPAATQRANITTAARAVSPTRIRAPPQSSPAPQVQANRKISPPERLDAGALQPVSVSSPAAPPRATTPEAAQTLPTSTAIGGPDASPPLPARPVPAPSPSTRRVALTPTANTKAALDVPLRFAKAAVMMPITVAKTAVTAPFRAAAAIFGLSGRVLRGLKEIGERAEASVQEAQRDKRPLEEDGNAEEVREQAPMIEEVEQSGHGEERERPLQVGEPERVLSGATPHTAPYIPQTTLLSAYPSLLTARTHARRRPPTYTSTPTRGPAYTTTSTSTSTPALASTMASAPISPSTSTASSASSSTAAAVRALRSQHGPPLLTTAATLTPHSSGAPPASHATDSTSPSNDTREIDATSPNLDSDGAWRASAYMHSYEHPHPQSPPISALTLSTDTHKDKNIASMSKQVVTRSPQHSATRASDHGNINQAGLVASNHSGTSQADPVPEYAVGAKQTSISSSPSTSPMLYFSPSPLTSSAAASLQSCLPKTQYPPKYPTHQNSMLSTDLSATRSPQPPASASSSSSLSPVVDSSTQASSVFTSMQALPIYSASPMFAVSISPTSPQFFSPTLFEPHPSTTAQATQQHTGPTAHADSQPSSQPVSSASASPCSAAALHSAVSNSAASSAAAQSSSSFPPSRSAPSSPTPHHPPQQPASLLRTLLRLPLSAATAFITHPIATTTSLLTSPISTTSSFLNTPLPQPPPLLATPISAASALITAPISTATSLLTSPLSTATSIIGAPLAAAQSLLTTPLSAASSLITVPITAATSILTPTNINTNTSQIARAARSRAAASSSSASTPAIMSAAASVPPASMAATPAAPSDTSATTTTTATTTTATPALSTTTRIAATTPDARAGYKLDSAATATHVTSTSAPPKLEMARGNGTEPGPLPGPEPVYETHSPISVADSGTRGRWSVKSLFKRATDAVTHTVADTVTKMESSARQFYNDALEEGEKRVKGAVREGEKRVEKLLTGMGLGGVQEGELVMHAIAGPEERAERRNAAEGRWRSRSRASEATEEMALGARADVRQGDRVRSRVRSDARSNDGHHRGSKVREATRTQDEQGAVSQERSGSRHATRGARPGRGAESGATSDRGWADGDGGQDGQSNSAPDSDVDASGTGNEAEILGRRFNRDKAVREREKAREKKRKLRAHTSNSNPTALSLSATTASSSFSFLPLSSRLLSSYITTFVPLPSPDASASTSRRLARSLATHAPFPSRSSDSADSPALSDTPPSSPSPTPIPQASNARFSTSASNTPPRAHQQPSSTQTTTSALSQHRPPRQSSRLRPGLRGGNPMYAGASCGNEHRSTNDYQCDSHHQGEKVNYGACAASSQDIYNGVCSEAHGESHSSTARISAADHGNTDSEAHVVDGNPSTTIDGRSRCGSAGAPASPNNMRSHDNDDISSSPNKLFSARSSSSSTAFSRTPSLSRSGSYSSASISSPDTPSLLPEDSPLFLPALTLPSPSSSMATSARTPFAASSPFSVPTASPASCSASPPPSSASGSLSYYLTLPLLYFMASLASLWYAFSHTLGITTTSAPVASSTSGSTRTLTASPTAQALARTTTPSNERPHQHDLSRRRTHYKRRARRRTRSPAAHSPLRTPIHTPIHARTPIATPTYTSLPSLTPPHMHSPIHIPKRADIKSLLPTATSQAPVPISGFTSYSTQSPAVAVTTANSPIADMPRHYNTYGTSDDYSDNLVDNIYKNTDNVSDNDHEGENHNHNSQHISHLGGNVDNNYKNCHRVGTKHDNNTHYISISGGLKGGSVHIATPEKIGDCSGKWNSRYLSLSTGVLPATTHPNVNNATVSNITGASTITSTDPNPCVTATGTSTYTRSGIGNVTPSSTSARSDTPPSQSMSSNKAIWSASAPSPLPNIPLVLPIVSISLTVVSPVIAMMSTILAILSPSFALPLLFTTAMLPVYIVTFASSKTLSVSMYYMYMMRWLMVTLTFNTYASVSDAASSLYRIAVRYAYDMIPAFSLFSAPIRYAKHYATAFAYSILRTLVLAYLYTIYTVKQVNVYVLRIYHTCTSFARTAIQMLIGIVDIYMRWASKAGIRTIWWSTVTSMSIFVRILHYVAAGTARLLGMVTKGSSVLASIPSSTTTTVLANPSSAVNTPSSTTSVHHTSTAMPVHARGQGPTSTRSTALAIASPGTVTTAATAAVSAAIASAHAAFAAPLLSGMVSLLTSTSMRGVVGAAVCTCALVIKVMKTDVIATTAAWAASMIGRPLIQTTTTAPLAVAMIVARPLIIAAIKAGRQLLNKKNGSGRAGRREWGGMWSQDRGSTRYYAQGVRDSTEVGMTEEARAGEAGGEEDADVDEPMNARAEQVDRQEEREVRREEQEDQAERQSLYTPLNATDGTHALSIAADTTGELAVGVATGVLSIVGNVVDTVISGHERMRERAVETERAWVRQRSMENASHMEREERRGVDRSSGGGNEDLSATMSSGVNSPSLSDFASTSAFSSHSPSSYSTCAAPSSASTPTSPSDAGNATLGSSQSSGISPFPRQLSQARPRRRRDHPRLVSALCSALSLPLPPPPPPPPPFPFPPGSSIAPRQPPVLSRGQALSLHRIFSPLSR